MARYVLVTVFEREITTSFYDTEDQAYDAMKEALLIDPSVKESYDNGDYEYNEDTKTYLGDDWELTPTFAWSNSNRGNWDASISEIKWMLGRKEYKNDKQNSNSNRTHKQGKLTICLNILVYVGMRFNSHPYFYLFPMV